MACPAPNKPTHPAGDESKDRLKELSDRYHANARSQGQSQALQSISCSRCNGVQPQEALYHPCFRVMQA
jgi:hypothetical protein